MQHIGCEGRSRGQTSDLFSFGRENFATAFALFFPQISQNAVDVEVKDPRQLLFDLSDFSDDFVRGWGFFDCCHGGSVSEQFFRSTNDRDFVAAVGHNRREFLHEGVANLSGGWVL